VLLLDFKRPVTGDCLKPLRKMRWYIHVGIPFAPSNSTGDSSALTFGMKDEQVPSWDPMIQTHILNILEPYFVMAQPSKQ